MGGRVFLWKVWVTWAGGWGAHPGLLIAAFKLALPCVNWCTPVLKQGAGYGAAS